MIKASLANKPTYLISSDKVIAYAVLVSVLLHLLIIFGISFENETTPTAMMQEVVDVLSNDERDSDKKADFIAANSQKGSGSLAKKQIIQSNDISPLTDDKINQMLDIENKQKQQTAKQYMQSYLRTTLSIEKIDQQNKKENDDKKSKDSKDEEERIMSQIATLEAQIGRQEKIYAKSLDVKTFTSAVDAQKSPEASYINSFRHRVEKLGNDNYPVEARAKNLHGDVRLMVIIDPNGKVKAIRLLQSSGSTLLDDFAKESVRQSAPFGKFTKNMKATELRLIRTWRFADILTTFADES